MKNETANIASTYTNLVASNKPGTVELAVYDAADNLLGIAESTGVVNFVTVPDQTISYNKLDEKRIMAQGHYVAYIVDGEKVSEDAIEYAVPAYSRKIDQIAGGGSIISSSNPDFFVREIVADEKTGVDFIIVIDSLACSDTERLCSTIQITDSGISPSSRFSIPLNITYLSSS